jgi:hypothetical protein
MLGGRSAYDLIAARPAGRTEALDMYVKELGKAGFGVLFLAPGTADEYVDLRTAHDIRNDGDTENPHAGIALATADPKRLAKYAKAAQKRWPDQPPNLSILADRTVVVEAKGEAAEAFRSRYTAETENLIGATLILPDGVEQFWFEAPEGWSLPEGTTELVAAIGDGVTVRSGAVPLVIAPSVRADGAMWQWVGEVNPAPDFLLAAIEAAIVSTAEPEPASPEPEVKPVPEDSSPQADIPRRLIAYAPHPEGVAFFQELHMLDDWSRSDENSTAPEPSVTTPEGGGYFWLSVPGGWGPSGPVVLGKGPERVHVGWEGELVPPPPPIPAATAALPMGIYVMEAIAQTDNPQRYRPPTPNSAPVACPTPVDRAAFDLIAAYDPAKTKFEEYVTALGTAGLELIFLEPGTKDRPSDLRTSRQRMADDEAARQRAKEAGNPRYLDAKTSAGIQIATADPERLAAYVERAKKWYPGEQPNLAMLVRNLIVVDADWEAGVDYFANIYRESTGDAITPTVLTPGVRRPDGTWKHRGGGHFYFELPEGWTLPEHVRTLTMGVGDAKVSIFIANQYILIPPSVRPEGPYQWVGNIREAPAGLLRAFEWDADRVATARAEWAIRAANRTGPDNIDRWAERTEWRDLLEPDGWFFTGSTTSCGCPEVTAPGVHASPKSATAHEVGCRETDTSSGHGPLHIWTDNPPAPLIAYITRPNGSKTMTKLQYVSWMHHGGDDGAAIRALGITTGHLMGGPKCPISAADIRERFAEADA